MANERSLLTDRDLLAAQDTLSLFKALFGIDIMLRRAREREALAEIRGLRRSRRQILDELERREESDR